MSIERSSRTYGRTQMTRIARDLLGASTLCAISTVSAPGRPHVNIAYFAWDAGLRLVWLSDPRARHSRNIRAGKVVAVAVYDSSQTWGGLDRGIQLFGSADRPPHPPESAPPCLATTAYSGHRVTNATTRSDSRRRW